jgi:hypothetical protein
MSRADLERLREWTTARLSSCKEPIGAEHPYLKLLESLNPMLARMNLDMHPSDGVLQNPPVPEFVRFWTKADKG